MKLYHFLKCAVPIALIVFTLTACGAIQSARSFSTQYQQPTDGERARVRVISDGMVRAVPNSDCVDWRLPGAGVMVTAKKGFAQVNNQKLDMPIGATAADKPTEKELAVSELYVPAGKPIVLHYLSQYYLSQSRHGYQCFLGRSFIPAAGASYEAAFLQEVSLCLIRVDRLLPEGGIDKNAKVELAETKNCRFIDNF